MHLDGYRYSYTVVVYIYICVCILDMCVHPTVKGKLILLTDSKPDLSCDPKQQQPM